MLASQDHAAGAACNWRCNDSCSYRLQSSNYWCLYLCLQFLRSVFVCVCVFYIILYLCVYLYIHLCVMLVHAWNYMDNPLRGLAKQACRYSSPLLSGTVWCSKWDALVQYDVPSGMPEWWTEGDFNCLGNSQNNYNSKSWFEAIVRDGFPGYPPNCQLEIRRLGRVGHQQTGMSKVWGFKLRDYTI